jgi:hypothetical protein
MEAHHPQTHGRLGWILQKTEGAIRLMAGRDLFNHHWLVFQVFYRLPIIRLGAGGTQETSSEILELVIWILAQGMLERRGAETSLGGISEFDVVVYWVIFTHSINL